MSAPDLKGTIAAAMKELVRVRDRVLPVKVGNMAIEHFKENFRKGGFSGTQWKDVLRRRLGFHGARGRYGPLTSGNNHLMSSFVKEVKPGKVVIENPVEYATVHNEGSRITVTARMNRFFWRMYYETGGRLSGGNTERNRAISREAEFWRNMALKKTGSQIEIPQRKFADSDPELKLMINRKIEEELNNVVKKYTNGRNIV